MNLLREIEVKLSARSYVQSAGPSAATGASGPAGWGSRIFWSQKMLNVQTECTYQALALIVPIRIGADDVLETLYPLLPRHGTPEYNRSDNGPEFVAQAMQYWLARVGIKSTRICPRSPWQNW